MTRTEIFENRHEVSKKLCEQIRRNDRQMINAKNFSERPYYDGEKKYKFSTANYLRLLSAENTYITPTFKIPTNFEMFQAFMQFLKSVFGFIVGGVIAIRAGTKSTMLEKIIGR